MRPRQEVHSGVAITHQVLQVLFLSLVGAYLVPVLCQAVSARVYGAPLPWKHLWLCLPFPC